MTGADDAIEEAAKVWRRTHSLASHDEGKEENGEKNIMSASSVSPRLGGEGTDDANKTITKTGTDKMYLA